MRAKIKKLLGKINGVIILEHKNTDSSKPYSTVTDFAKFLGLSMSYPLFFAE